MLEYKNTRIKFQILFNVSNIARVTYRSQFNGN